MRRERKETDKRPWTAEDCHQRREMKRRQGQHFKAHLERKKIKTYTSPVAVRVKPAFGLGALAFAFAFFALASSSASYRSGALRSSIELTVSSSKRNHLFLL